MALPTPDMQSCCRKERCLRGDNIGLVYDVCDPCQGGIFDEEACDCISIAGIWRVVVTTFISPGGVEGYSDPDCGTTTPATVVNTFKSESDSGPGAFPWTLTDGAYMYVLAAPGPGSDYPTDDDTASYYVRSGTPTWSNTTIKWNKTGEFVRGDDTIAAAGSSRFYIAARDANDNIIPRGSSSAVRIEATDLCSRGPNVGDNPSGYVQGWSNVVYEKWDAENLTWVAQPVKSTS